MEDPAIAASEGYINYDDIEDETVRAEVFADTRSERLRTADLMIRSALFPYFFTPVGMFVFLGGVSLSMNKDHAGIGIMLLGLAITGLFVFLGLRKRKLLIGSIKTKREIENSIQIHD